MCLSAAKMVLHATKQVLASCCSAHPAGHVSGDVKHRVLVGQQYYLHVSFCSQSGHATNKHQHANNASWSSVMCQVI
jgi:hypothetical protein